MWRLHTALKWVGTEMSRVLGKVGGTAHTPHHGCLGIPWGYSQVVSHDYVNLSEGNYDHAQLITAFTGG